LRIVVALLFLFGQLRCDRVLRGHRIAHALGAAEAGLHGAFVLVDGVKAGGEIADKKPGDKTNHTTEEDNAHKVWLLNTACTELDKLKENTAGNFRTTSKGVSPNFIPA
jgi:hypothetical protein